MSTIGDDLKVAGGIGVSASSNAIPPDIKGGTGAIDLTNRVNGSIHLRTDTDTVPEVMHNNAAEKLGFAQHCMECRMSTLVANSANTFTTYMPRNAKITGVSRAYATVPVSAAGTVLTGITINGNPILLTANENEEGLTNETLAAHSLSGTAANLLVLKGQKVIITITSNNADMTGGAVPKYYIYYETN